MGGVEGRADKPTQTDTLLRRLVRGKTKKRAQKGAMKAVSDGADGKEISPPKPTPGS